MLHRLLFMMLVLGSFNALIPSSAAADVKSSAATAATAPLVLPQEISRLFFEPFGAHEHASMANMFQVNTRIISWLREHPQYINARVEGRSSIFETIFVAQHTIDNQRVLYFSPVAQELFNLKALPNDRFLKKLLTSLWSAGSAPEMFTFLYQTLDMMIYHGADIPAIKAKIQSFIPEYNRNLGIYPHIDPPAIVGALHYLDTLNEINKLHAAKLRSVLDPILPPVLQQIAVDYAVPAEAAHPVAPPQTPAPQ